MTDQLGLTFEAPDAPAERVVVTAESSRRIVEATARKLAAKKAGEERTEQTVQAKRVGSRIDAHVIQFCRERVGEEFHGRDLDAYVAATGVRCAPGSPCRRMRHLAREAHAITVELISRSASLYRVVGVRGE